MTQTPHRRSRGCFAAYVASGQTCVSGTRLILGESIYNEFMVAIIDKKFESPADESRIESHVFHPNNVNKFIEAPVAFAKVGRGWMAMCET